MFKDTTIKGIFFGLRDFSPVLKKKHKYLILSAVITLLLFIFPVTAGVSRIIIAVTTLLVSILGTLWVQYGTYGKLDLGIVLNTTLLPVHLVLGALLSLIFFPNLGIPTRVVALVAVGALMYTVALVNNILLVVTQREQTIPLYRVAITWSQILLVVIAIPYFAGIFKLPINSLYQGLITAGSAFLFSGYLIWAQSMDSDFPKLEVGEALIHSLLISFIVFVFGISVSFIPTESFLRSLFVSSGLMFALGYMQAHYKNLVTKKLVREYLLIIGLFLLLLLTFN